MDAAPSRRAIETTGTSTTVELTKHARVTAGPNTRAEPIAPEGTHFGFAVENRLLLVRGTLAVQFDCMDIGFTARCYGELIVVTPAADLGCDIDWGRRCEYTVELGPGGVGAVRVQTGAVSSNGGIQIPAGARMSLSLEGPRAHGTPYFESATEAFVEALARLDRGPDEEALAVLLREARRKDSLTLWHLQIDGARQQEAVSRRLQKLVPPPPSNIINSDQRAREWLLLARETWR